MTQVGREQHKPVTLDSVLLYRIVEGGLHEQEEAQMRKIGYKM